MDESVGVWIDRREAILVKHSEMGDQTIRIQSGVAQQLHCSDESPKGPFELKCVLADDAPDRRITPSIATFYDRVIASLGQPDSLLIVGPGDAKRELRIRIDESRIHIEAVTVEAADRLTESQIVARLRRFLTSTIRLL